MGFTTRLQEMLEFEVERRDGKVTIVYWWPALGTAEEACKQAGIPLMQITAVATEMREAKGRLSTIPSRRR